MGSAERPAPAGPCEVFATMVNTGLDALRLQEWFPAGMSTPLGAIYRAFQSNPSRQATFAMVGPPDAAIVLKSVTVWICGGGNSKHRQGLWSDTVHW